MEQFFRNDGRKCVRVLLSAVIIKTYVAGITQDLINSVRQERLTPMRQSPMLQCFDDLPRDLTGCVLIEDIPHRFRFILIDKDLLIDDFVAIGDAPADKVSFFSALVLSAADLLRKLGGVRMNLWT